MSPLWPATNAALNAACALLLVRGFLYIRRGNAARHRICMILAFLTSVIFLASYLAYHAVHGSTRFPGIGWARPLYFSILISHTALAILIVPLALRTLYLAWRGRFDAHKRIARWTLPLWLYVSVTGVVVYGMLYRVSWE